MKLFYNIHEADIYTKRNQVILMVELEAVTLGANNQIINTNIGWVFGEEKGVIASNKRELIRLKTYQEGQLVKLTLKAPESEEVIIEVVPDGYLDYVEDAINKQVKEVQEKLNQEYQSYLTDATNKLANDYQSQLNEKENTFTKVKQDYEYKINKEKEKISANYKKEYQENAKEIERLSEKILNQDRQLSSKNEQIRDSIKQIQSLTKKLNEYSIKLNSIGSYKKEIIQLKSTISEKTTYIQSLEHKLNPPNKTQIVKYDNKKFSKIIYNISEITQKSHIESKYHPKYDKPKNLIDIKFDWLEIDRLSNFLINFLSENKLMNEAIQLQKDLKKALDINSDNFYKIFYEYLTIMKNHKKSLLNKVYSK